jgi:GR25 family glycosyltransferase involved in LPS biosynthesis
MNHVKVYIICKNELEYLFSKEQCNYIEKGGECGRRQGGSFNVKYIFNESYQNGFMEAIEFIKENKFMKFGVILFGNEHYNRRMWTIIHKFANEYDNAKIHITLGLIQTFLYSNANANFQKNSFLAEEIVSKHFEVITWKIEENQISFEQSSFQPCFVSKSFLTSKTCVHQENLNLNKASIDRQVGFIQPPLCIPNHEYEKLDIVHYSKSQKDYDRSLCMIHYLPAMKTQSLFNKMFDGVYCINLSSRQDRLVKFSNKMEKHNIQFERYNAVSKTFLNSFSQIVMPNDPLLTGNSNKSGLLGCLLSHMGVMKTALSRGQKQILIFEDDVSIHKHAESFFEKFIASLEENGISFKSIDILHLGYLPIVKKGTFESPDIWSYRFLDHVTGTVLKSKHFIGCHAYAVSEKFMKSYIEFYSKLDIVDFSLKNGDNKCMYSDFNGWPTNDWAIRNFFLENKEFVCYAPCPQIFAVTPSVSDNSLLTEDDDIECRITNTNFTYFDDYE